MCGDAVWTGAGSDFHKERSMWIKTLDTDVWININHITHFSLSEPYFHNRVEFEAYAFLDASHEPPRNEFSQDQVYLKMYGGSYKKCERFIKNKLRWQSVSQWIGYLVAGGVGAVLTYLLGLLKS